MAFWFLSITIAITLAAAQTRSATTSASRDLLALQPRALLRSQSSPLADRPPHLHRTASSGPLPPERAAALLRRLDLRDLLRGSPRLLANLRRQPPEVRRAVATRLRNAFVATAVRRAPGTALAACDAAYADFAGALRAGLYALPWDGRAPRPPAEPAFPDEPVHADERARVHAAVRAFVPRAAALARRLEADAATLRRGHALLAELAAPAARPRDARMLGAARLLLHVEADVCDGRLYYARRWQVEFNPRPGLPVLEGLQLPRRQMERAAAWIRHTLEPSNVEVLRARQIPRASWEEWAKWSSKD